MRCREEKKTIDRHWVLRRSILPYNGLNRNQNQSDNPARWNDDNRSLRPALEDIFGAGAILASFGDKSMSPESSGAIGLYEKLKNAPEMYLLDSVSGRELVNMGFKRDVEISSQLNVSTFVPVFNDGCYASYTL